MERNERTLDKRKAHHDKETDEEATDTSLNKNPTKRARVDYSSSPKEKSPSPASAQRSPLKSSWVADSTAAATPSVNDIGNAEKSNSNGDLSPASSKKNGSSDGGPALISKFDLPSPFTTQELEQKIGRGGETNEDSDSDNGSTKFLSGIIQSEENKKKRQGKGGGSGNSSGSMESGGRNGAPSSTNSKRGGTPAKSITTKGPVKSSQPVMTSSPHSDLSTVSTLSNGNTELEVVIRLNNPTTQAPFLDETVFIADFKTIETFFRQNNKVFVPPSSQVSTVSSSGYLGDVSSIDNSASHVQGTQKTTSTNSRWTISSLGSTIPRVSIVSIATDTSEDPEDKMKKPGRPISKARKRNDGPIMSSTKYDDSSRNNSSGLMDRMHVSPHSPLSNGGDFKPASTKSQSSRPTDVAGSSKKMKGTPSKSQDEGIGTSFSTPGSARKGDIKASPGSANTNASLNSGSGTSSKKPGARRRRGGSANNFPITNIQTPVLNTPPPARSRATIEGTVAKPLTQFEQEMNNEPVVEADLEKASTLWSTILPEELVFARWRDKSYYSGMIKAKGMNDTWVIDFDDGMDDVASETHIVPIRILGVGVKGIYCPDEKFEARSAEVIGQKFMMDPETNRQNVKYAIKISGEPKPIWCTRRQLSIKEADAKKLRMEYQPPVAQKAGDVSLDNIVSGPRRRTRGGNETENSSSESKIAGAFDTSSADDNLKSTPKPQRGSKAGKKTPASEAKKKRVTNPAAATATTPVTKDASTSSPSTEVVVKKDTSPVKKESPAKKKTVIELGKKKSKKTLFQGIQFFLTASGGGDPGISGTPIIPAEPYDKEDIRDQIENSGGAIIDTVGSETADDVFLISDSYARTVKYIYCLAATIPCVSHCWVKRCLEMNEIVDWKVFKLPAGWSLENQDLILDHERKPLKSCKIFVTSESDQLYNYWKPVLTAAEAILMKPPKKKGTFIPAGTEVIVTDDHSDSIVDLVREAERLHLPYVKPEWLVQTIITGEKAHMYGHEKYRILLNDTEESEGATGEALASVEESNENYDVLAEMQTPD